MGKVVSMSDFQHAPKQGATTRFGTPAFYYCTHCGVDRFTLSPSGAINCAHCGAVMRNLQVSKP